MPGPSRMPLTRRQAEVLTAAAAGATLTAIAANLGLPRGTVASHLARAYERLDVTYLPRGERRAAAVRAAVQQGLIHIPDPQKGAAA